MEIHFAPMQGYTDSLYRKFHFEIYGGINCYYTPFIRIEHGQVRRQDLLQLQASIECDYPLVPQIIFNSIDQFFELTDTIKAMGYKRIDLNLGCPYPMQTRKGKGAAMISNVDTMHHIAQAIADDSGIAYSIKMRLGLDSAEWPALMPLLNDIPLHHITLHPRTARQMYGDVIDYDELKLFVAASINPVIYNGNISCIEDIDYIAESFPKISGVMIGRGLLARPSLAKEYADGCKWSKSSRIKSLLSFGKCIFEGYKDTLCGQSQILQKIKPFWENLEPEIGHKAYKAIKKSNSIDQYLQAIKSIGSFDSQSL